MTYRKPLRRRALAFASSIAVIALPALARAQGNMALMNAHLDSAKMFARSDVSPAILSVLCADQKTVPLFLAPIVAKSKPMPPTKAFDNLVYLGMDFVGSWALNTSDGIILFDALDNEQEARDIIEGGLQKLGMDPARIKDIVVMHGHADHYGGAKYLAEKYHAKVYMSQADWDFAPNWVVDYTKAVGAAGMAKYGPIPTKDGIITDGMKLKLGDETVTFYITPGHTPGTLSAIIPVKDGAKSHTLSFWGGTALPADAPGKALYEKSAERFIKIVDAAKVDGVISNHPFIDGTSDKVNMMMARKSGDANPFVIGHEAVMRYMNVHLQCVRSTEQR